LYRILTHRDGHPDSEESSRSTQALGLEVRFTVQCGPRRRYRFELRDAGPGWWRFEDEWTGCQWRPVGREAVDTVALRVVHR
jgi:hypothetical protein